MVFYCYPLFDLVQHSSCWDISWYRILWVSHHLLIYFAWQIFRNAPGGFTDQFAHLWWVAVLCVDRGSCLNWLLADRFMAIIISYCCSGNHLESITLEWKDSFHAYWNCHYFRTASDSWDYHRFSTAATIGNFGDS